MRLLHTSDWHLGRTLAQESLAADQQHLLEQVLRALRDTRADALIIAGDVFDRANPPREAVALFADFLRRVYHETRAAIVVIAGNHDAPERVSFNAALADPARVLIRGPLGDGAAPLVLQDAHGPVAISALPFAETYAARAHFADDSLVGPAAVLASQVAAARALVPSGARWVVTAHGFVAGGRGSDGERPLGQVGGLDEVPATLFAGAHYVALGHLHRPQAVGAAHVRYCGSWMGFGFDEADEPKSLSLVELDGTGRATVTPVPLAPLRPLRVLTGTMAELLAQGRAMPATARQALIKAVITDTGALVDPMGQLRTLFPHALQLERAHRIGSGAAWPGAGGAGSAGPPGNGPAASPAEVVARFIDHVRGTAPSPAEQAWLDRALREAARQDGSD